MGGLREEGGMPWRGAKHYVQGGRWRGMGKGLGVVSGRYEESGSERVVGGNKKRAK